MAASANSKNIFVSSVRQKIARLPIFRDKRGNPPCGESPDMAVRVCLGIHQSSTREAPMRRVHDPRRCPVTPTYITGSFPSPLRPGPYGPGMGFRDVEDAQALPWLPGSGQGPALRRAEPGEAGDGREVARHGHVRLRRRPLADDAPVRGVDDHRPDAFRAYVPLRRAVGALPRRKLEVPDPERGHRVEGEASAQVTGGVGPAVPYPRPRPQGPEAFPDAPARPVAPQGGLRRPHAVAAPAGQERTVRRLSLPHDVPRRVLPDGGDHRHGRRAPVGGVPRCGDVRSSAAQRQRGDARPGKAPGPPRPGTVILRWPTGRPDGRSARIPAPPGEPPAGRAAAAASTRRHGGPDAARRSGRDTAPGPPPGNPSRHGPDPRACRRGRGGPRRGPASRPPRAPPPAAAPGRRGRGPSPTA